VGTLQRWLVRLGNLAARPRRLQTLVTRTHARILRMAGGRIRRSRLLAGGQPVLVLTTTGRRSGKRRSTPVAYLRDGETIAITAANAGLDRPPAWWLNLQAHPEAEIELDGERMRVRARRAEPGAEEARLRRGFLQQLPAAELTWAMTDREIPVIVLERSA
jgi:deazaflavin-dependent oxidoreductase (nitroreductase family)